MSVFVLVLLALAVVLLVAAELPRLAGGRRLPVAPKPRRRPQRKPHLHVVRDEESDEFARAVERDLANLPTYDPRAKKD